MPTTPPPFSSSRLLLDEHPLVLLPSLVRLLGRQHLPALFLQQLHYWLRQSGHLLDGHYWIYKTYDDWAQELVSSHNTVIRVVAKLREVKLILTTSLYNKRPADNTLWYTIDYDELNALLSRSGASLEIHRPSTQNGQTTNPSWVERQPKLGKALPETTTETNTDIPPAGAGGPAPAATTNLTRTAWRLYQELIDPTAAEGVRARLVRMMRQSLDAGVDLTPEGIRYALEEAAGRSDVIAFAKTVWTDKPHGLEEGATHVSNVISLDRRGAAGPGSTTVPLDGERDRLTHVLDDALSGLG